MSGRVQYYGLALEVTRRCNMSCKHCLRGDAQDVDMPLDVVDLALRDACYIEQIAFTGGEPALNLPAVERALEACERHGIQVESFFMATNGSIVTDELISLLGKWDAYCLSCASGMAESESAVTVSLDAFHDGIPAENIRRLEALPTYSDMKTIDWKKAKLKGSGRAAGLEGYRTDTPEWKTDPWICMHDGRIIADDRLLISANGDIITDPDYEYAMESRLSIGNVRDGTHDVLENFIRNHERRHAS